MNRAGRLIGFGVVAWSVVLAGCSDDQTTAAKRSTSSSTMPIPTAAATTTAPVPDVSVQVSKDPRFSTSATTFGRGDAVYIGVTLGPGIKYDDAVFVWNGNRTGANPPDLATEQTNSDPITPGTLLTVYKMSAASGWEVGTYSVGVKLHGKIVQEVEFTIE